MLPRSLELNLSGVRLTATYRLAGSEPDARALAEDLCVEQTVEFPRALLPAGDIPNQVLGRVEEFSPAAFGHWCATVSFPVEAAGTGDLTQLLNVLFGNISIRPGVRLEALDLPDSLCRHFAGPRFGREGLRALVGVNHRPLLATALKPMGLSAEQLADLAQEFALGGIDLIKDDHGLANQSFAPWRERVAQCSEAVAQANTKTGGHSLYLPNLNGPIESLLEKAHEAKRLGAGGLLIAPGLAGFDAMRALADDDSLALPLMSHPAFLGSYVTHPDLGISHKVLFGQVMRLAGADASVYPNYGGRFSFSPEECQDIVTGTEVLMGKLASIFPAPGGGMTLERVPELVKFYGRDVILLMGGGLFQGGGSIQDNTRRFLELLG